MLEQQPRGQLQEQTGT